MKVRLQECLQLSGTNGQANRQKGQNTIPSGSQKPVCGAQLFYQKETSNKVNGKQEQISSYTQKPNRMPAQRTDQEHPASHAHKDENKEMTQKPNRVPAQRTDREHPASHGHNDENKENDQGEGKSKKPKYVEYFAIFLHRVSERFELS